MNRGKMIRALLSRYSIPALLLLGCSKGGDGDTPPAPPPVVQPPLTVSSVIVSGANATAGSTVYGVGLSPVLRFVFSTPLDRSSVTPANLGLVRADGTVMPYTASYGSSDSILQLQPSSALTSLSKYSVALGTGLRSAGAKALGNPQNSFFVTGIDSSRKFPAITDDALLDLVQSQTFRYFWDFGHPVSGMARERSNGDNNTVTSGGTGFGIMAIVTGIHRGFITRAEGLARLQTMVAFLKNTAVTFHGAYSHWLHGATGAALPFSQKDDGADLVETSYLVQGLLTARQYFTASGSEALLRADINFICDRVEWDWFRRGGQNVLYWHWSPAYNWEMNLPVRGWNECLITYVLAASSVTHPVPASVYAEGWTRNGAAGFVNGGSFYGHRLPLGENLGGPLFFSHYSFLGINPNGLSDAYASYQEQVTNHTLINYDYSRSNPRGHYGYSDSVWGLTASDIPNGYTASSPTNDVGVIAPTAALSSFPYTPVQSAAALKFFYYVLGDRLFREYGFVDAFSLKEPWFASSYLAIDQGPIIIGIENYRSGLLWDLFTSCPEVKTGMRALSFTAPYL